MVKAPLLSNNLKWILFLLIVGWLAACQPHTRHAEEVNVLEQLHDSVSTALTNMNSQPEDLILAAANWANENLQEFELLLSDGRITIVKSEGQIISEVSRSRRLLKDQAQRRPSLQLGAERTLIQLENLRSALKSSALHDATGTPIDSVYIAQNMRIETRVAREVIAALNEIITLAQRGQELVEQTRASNDSLQQVLRSRLAASVLGLPSESILVQ